MEKSRHPIEFRISKRKRSNLEHARTNFASTIREEESAARILMALSRDTSFFTPSPSIKLESCIRSESQACLPRVKIFSSQQVLGVHKLVQDNAFLKRKRTEDLVPINEVVPVVKTHACKVCGKMYPTGQALGGHMREHYKGVIVREKKKVNFEFDLNYPPEKVYKRKKCENNVEMMS